MLDVRVLLGPYGKHPHVGAAQAVIEAKAGAISNGQKSLAIWHVLKLPGNRCGAASVVAAALALGQGNAHPTRVCFLVGRRAKTADLTFFMVDPTFMLKHPRCPGRRTANSAKHPEGRKRQFRSLSRGSPLLRGSAAPSSPHLHDEAQGVVGRPVLVGLVAAIVLYADAGSTG